MERRYDRSSDLKMWQIIERLLNNGTILVSAEVIYELNKFQNRGKWIKNNYPHAVVSSDREIQDEVRRLVNSYPINHQNNNNWADPFVVAVALIKEGKVVTMETVNRHLIDNPHEIHTFGGTLKIPNYCVLEDIEYLDLTQFLVEIGSF